MSVFRIVWGSVGFISTVVGWRMVGLTKFDDLFSVEKLGVGVVAIGVLMAVQAIQGDQS